MTTALPATIATEMGWHFDNTYARLPDAFFARVLPAPVRAPGVVVVNHGLADAMGLRTRGVDDATLAAVFAGQVLPAGADPIAQAYAGHQFGGFTVLGDGRAILLGEQRTPDGRLLDVQFKGSGPTPYSRRGDGRAALGPMLREYVISEAMHALGIPTTRALAVVTTGEPVYRERVLRGAVLTRVAASHVRVGTFEYFAAHRNVDGLRTLVAYVVDRHDPSLTGREDAALALLDAVTTRQAALVARWMGVGFVHGVMNTDNMAVSGETIDYGPCAFLDRYHPDTVFSSIDQMGRYAYAQQPGIAQWNLARFAEALLPLLAPEREAAIDLAKGVVHDFPARFERAWMHEMRRKLGLADARDTDGALVAGLLGWMEQEGADLTNTFRSLSADGDVSEGPSGASAARAAWSSDWAARVAAEGSTIAVARERMRAVNPVVIPRNHQVEAALAGAERDDLAPLTALLASVQRPFEDGPWHDGFREAGAEGDEPYRTFCGT